MSTLLRFLIAATVSSFLLMSAGCGSSNEASSEAASHITRAETYSDQGQYRSAVLEVKNALQKDPGNVDHVVALAHIYNEIGAGEPASELLTPWMDDHSDQVALPLARAYLQQGKHLSARETLEKVSPSSDEARLERQVLLAESKRIGRDTDAAVEDYRTILDSHPEHQDATAGLARALIIANEPNAALDLLRSWTERNGNHPEILYLTGLAHYRLGNVEDTTAVLTDATSSVPATDMFLPIRRNILTLLSRSLTEQGRITEAQVYNKVLAENTNSETRERAESALDAITRGDLDTARTTLEELLQQNPDNEQVALMLGVLNLQEGRRSEAESLLVKNVDAETTPTPFIRAATMAQLDSGKREEALATLTRAVEARPNDVDLLGMHGLLALSLPEHQYAGVVSLSKALDLDRSRSRLRLALARYYQNEGQTEQALAQLRAAFTETPEDWSVTRAYLALALNTNRETEAKEIAESLLNGFADEPQAVTLAAITEHRLGETDSARARLEEQVEAQPENLAALVALASVYQSEGEHDKAVDSLLKAARLQPANLNLMQAAARAYARNRSPDEVVSWLNQVTDDHEALSPNAHSLAAQIQVQQGNLEQAKELLSRIPDVQQTSESETVRIQLLVAEAEQAATQGDWATARAKAGEAAALRPDNLSMALIPVQVLAAEGKHEDALASLDELESNHGAQAAIDLTRARLLAAQKDEGAAYGYLQERWQATGNPELLPALVNLARASSPEDVDDLTRAWVDATPNSAAPHLSRAEFEMASGKEEDAVASYESALDYRPDDATALNNLAWLLREKEQEHALELAARAAELAPENAAVLDTYGWILHLAGQQQQAVEFINRALVIAPDNPEIEEHLIKAKQGL